MKVAFDIDGTLDADPTDFESLMAALKAAGHQIVVITGASSKKVTQQDYEDKANYLNELGLGNCYDELVVFGDPPHKAKAKYCKKHNVALLFDNSVKNAKLASKYCVVLVPWANKTD